MPSRQHNASQYQTDVPGWPEAVSTVASDAAGLISRALETCESPPMMEGGVRVECRQCSSLAAAAPRTSAASCS